MTLLYGLILQECISFQLENSQFKSLFIIVLLEFNDPLDGLYLINVVFRFKVAIKLWCLNLKVSKIVPRRPSSSNSSIFMVFMRRQVCDINRVDIKLPVASGTVFRSFNLLKLCGELLYLLKEQ